MSILILLMTIFLIAGLFAVIIAKFMNAKYNLQILSKINLVLFLLITMFSSVYPFEGIGTALETLSFCLMFGFLTLVLWKILFDQKEIKPWLLAWAGSSALYLVAGLIKYSQDGMIKNIVDFGMILIPSILILTIVCMIKKHDFGRILCKILGISYIVFSFLFSVMPPNDLGTVIMSLIMMLLIGGVCSIGLIIRYRKIYSPVNAVYGMMDEQ